MVYWNAGRDYTPETLGSLMLNWELARAASGPWRSGRGATNIVNYN